jgi:hypothetical protein
MGDGMKRFVICAVSSLLLIATTQAQKASLPANAVAALHAAAPSISWDHALSATADVTCHGQNDTIAVGHDEHNMWLGVIPGSRAKRRPHALVQSWPVGVPAQNAMCAMPVRIELYPRTCDNQNGPLEGCKPIKGCIAFSLADDQCDGLNFYWSDSEHRLMWWRR